jgi:hypothetical protein
MADRERLLNSLDEAREMMRAVLDGIDLAMEIYPGWTIKYVLAHIAGWDDATAVSFRAHIAGDEPGTPAARGIDHYNAESVATREALDFERIRQEWEMSRQELKKAIADMTDEKLNTPLILPWGPYGTVEQAVRIFVEHEEEHAKEIARMQTKEE